MESVDPGSLGSKVLDVRVTNPAVLPSGLGDSSFSRIRPENEDQVLFILRLR